jgi:RNA polymerase sigma-70 factor (ECF subfamily)
MQAAAHPSLLSRCDPAPGAEGAAPADDELVAQALAGSVRCQELLAARYRGRLYAFALAMLRHPEDAEDVAQETLVRAFGTMATYRGGDRFRAWLFRIAGNLCRDRTRRPMSRDVALDAAHQELPAPSREDPGRQVVLRTTVFAAVARLPELYRGPVVLHYMEGLSVPETAGALGRATATVRVQLWRARTLLAEALADCWKEDGR